MSARLKKCPFCGGEADLFEIPMPPEYCGTDCVWAVQCMDCEIATPNYDTAKDAAEAWNQRVGRSCRNLKKRTRKHPAKNKKESKR